MSPSPAGTAGRPRGSAAGVRRGAPGPPPDRCWRADLAQLGGRQELAALRRTDPAVALEPPGLVREPEQGGDRDVHEQLHGSHLPSVLLGELAGGEAVAHRLGGEPVDLGASGPDPVERLRLSRVRGVEHPLGLSVCPVQESGRFSAGVGDDDVGLSPVGQLAPGGRIDGCSVVLGLRGRSVGSARSAGSSDSVTPVGSSGSALPASSAGDSSASGTRVEPGDGAAPEAAGAGTGRGVGESAAQVKPATRRSNRRASRPRGSPAICWARAASLSAVYQRVRGMAGPVTIAEAWPSRSLPKRTPRPAAALDALSVAAPASSRSISRRAARRMRSGAIVGILDDSTRSTASATSSSVPSSSSSSAVARLTVTAPQASSSSVRGALRTRTVARATWWAAARSWTPRAIAIAQEGLPGQCAVAGADRLRHLRCQGHEQEGVGGIPTSDDTSRLGEHPELEAPGGSRRPPSDPPPPSSSWFDRTFEHRRRPGSAGACGERSSWSGGTEGAGQPSVAGPVKGADVRGAGAVSRLPRADRGADAG